MADAPKPSVGTTAGAVDTSVDAEKLQEGMAGVRELLRRTGTAIGAVATAVIAGLGYTRLHEVFPIPKNANAWSTWLLLLFLIAALIGSAWLAARFFGAQRRILLTSDLEEDRADSALGRVNQSFLIWWSRHERRVVKDVLQEHAAEEGAASLLALELRSLRFSRLARQPTERIENRASVAKEGERLGEFVGLALTRASATLLEYRARRAFGPITAIPLFLAVGGVIGLFVYADYYKGERDLVDLRKKCVEAEAAGVSNACAVFESDEQQADRIAVAITEALDARREAVFARQPTPEQRELLERVAACVREVNSNPTTKMLDADVKSAAIALCAQK